jgi:hypothetical protein
MAPRKGIRRRLGRRRDRDPDARAGDGATRERLEELTERTRREARALSRKRRIEARREARRALRAQTPGLDIGVRLRGAGYETRRLLRPVFAPVGAVLSAVAPFITRSLLFVIQLVGALVALLLALAQLVIGRLRTSLGVLGMTVADWTRRHVTPRGTVAFVGACAAVLLGAAQFADYHGVAVDAEAYSGPIGRTAPAPITGTETAGSAHLWVLLPVAAAALVFAVAAYLGSRRFAAGLVICGVLGLAVALAIDLPQGLETGREGLAFYGADPELLGGFWVEIASSATLILCGCLLPLYSRSSARPGRGRRGATRSRASHRDVGEIPPGLRAES